MIDYDELALWQDGFFYDYIAPVGEPDYCSFMYDPAKTSFYKIVTKDNNFNSVKIKSGTILKFNESDTRRASFGLQGPFFHFAKGAFNTTLWRESIDYDEDGEIYKVLPLSPVVGNISEGKAQFGAQRLMFLNRVSPKQLFQKALKELEESPEETKMMNPLCYEEGVLPFLLEAWKKNKLAGYIY